MLKPDEKNGTDITREINHYAKKTVDKNVANQVVDNADEFYYTKDDRDPKPKNKKNIKSNKTKTKQTNEKTKTKTEQTIDKGALKEKIRMLTKQFEPKEMLAFNKLRTINQKELISSLETNDKLGIVIKDQLKVAMIDMEKYQKLVDTVQEHYRLLEWIDERELFQEYKLQERLNSNEWEEIPEGMSFLEWAGIQSKG